MANSIQRLPSAVVNLLSSSLDRAELTSLRGVSNSIRSDVALEARKQVQLQELQWGILFANPKFSNNQHSSYEARESWLRSLGVKTLKMTKDEIEALTVLRKSIQDRPSVLSIDEKEDIISESLPLYRDFRDRAANYTFLNDEGPAADRYDNDLEYYATLFFEERDIDSQVPPNSISAVACAEASFLTICEILTKDGERAYSPLDPFRSSNNYLSECLFNRLYRLKVSNEERASSTGVERVRLLLLMVTCIVLEIQARENPTAMNDFHHPTDLIPNNILQNLSWVPNGINRYMKPEEYLAIDWKFGYFIYCLPILSATILNIASTIPLPDQQRWNISVVESISPTTFHGFTIPFVALRQADLLIDSSWDLSAQDDNSYGNIGGIFANLYTAFYKGLILLQDINFRRRLHRPLKYENVHASCWIASPTPIYLALEESFFKGDTLLPLGNGDTVHALIKVIRKIMKGRRLSHVKLRSMLKAKEIRAYDLFLKLNGFSLEELRGTDANPCTVESPKVAPDLLSIASTK